MTDTQAAEAAARVQAFVNKWQMRRPALALDENVVWTLGPSGDTAMLTIGHLSALLDDREQLLACIARDGEHSWALSMERDTAMCRAEKAEAILARVTDRMAEYDRHGSRMVNVRQVLNLLSPTWPDGNYSNEAS